MAINEQELASYLDELGMDQSIRDSVLGEFKKNERAATQFVGQRLRHADYTKKTQELTKTKEALEQAANGQIGEYAKQLQAAEAKIQRIMGDYEKETISRSTAEARLMKVKETYSLSDDDIPPVTTPQAAAKAQSTEMDVTGKLEEFRKSLMTEIRREMSYVPQLNALQYDIMRQHKELTGKDLTALEVKELNEKGAKNQGGLMRAWEETYNIPTIRTDKLIESRLTSERQKWDDEQKAARSNEAMAQATSASRETPFTAESSVLKRVYERRDGDTGLKDPATQQPTSQTQQQKAPAPPAQKLSGAERAAAKWIDRAQAGQLGKPVTA